MIRTTIILPGELHQFAIQAAAAMEPGRRPNLSRLVSTLIEDKRRKTKPNDKSTRKKGP